MLFCSERIRSLLTLQASKSFCLKRRNMYFRKVVPYEQDRHPAHTCMSYFLSSCPPWVKQKDLIECKIYCPNCSYRLGMLQWQGIQCSYILPMCSQWFVNHKWHLGESGYSIFEIQGWYENGASSPKNQTGSGVDGEACCRSAGEACFGIRGETESRLSAVIVEEKKRRVNGIDCRKDKKKKVVLRMEMIPV